MLRIHVLIDLEWTATSGGQVTCWQHLADAARKVEGLQLSLHAQGETRVEVLHENATLYLRPPIFSTRKIPFLHAPAHTDMADFHPVLAHALESADVIHTTDAFFCYAKTAEKIAREKNIPLTHSAHTDTVKYSEIFAKRFLERNLGPVGTGLDAAFGIAKNAGNSMRKRFVAHVSACKRVLVSREEDRLAAAQIIGPQNVRNYRLGLDRSMFTPEKRDRAEFEKRYNIPHNSIVILFVGRLDEGKNIYRLIGGMQRALKNNAPLFLLAAGLGPAEKDILNRLPARAVTPGFLGAEDLSLAYASADWLALPSTVETWSLVAEEALASGLPLIASCGSGVGRFLGAEGAGILVTENTDQAWESALLEACGLHDMERLRKLARASALAQFPGWDEALMQDFLPVWKEARD